MLSCCEMFWRIVPNACLSPLMFIDVISLPGFFDLEENELVTIEVLPFVANAPELWVEPLTTADWKRLERGASCLEDGEFLRQITVVYSGQILSLTVSPSETAQVRVLTRNFVPPEEPSFWPEDLNDRPTRSRISHYSLRLVASTQVVIVPKVATDETVLESPPFRLAASYDDYAQAMHALADTLDLVEYAKLPWNTAAVHPITFAKLPGNDSNEQEYAATLRSCNSEHLLKPKKLSVRLVSSDCVPNDRVALHPYTRISLGLDLFVDCVTLELISRLEADRYIDNTEMFMHSGSIKIGLFPIRFIFPRRDHPWCEPEPLRLLSASAATLPNSKEERKQGDNSTRHSKHSLVEFVGDGAIVSLPLEEGSSTSLYRLCVQFLEKRASSGDESCLISLKRLHFLSQQSQMIKSNRISESPIVFHDHSDTELLEDATSSLVNLLPSATVISSGLIQRAPTSVTNAGFVLQGGKGSGKTHTALMIAAILRLRHSHATFYLNCQGLKDQLAIRLSDILREFDDIFAMARRSSPSVLILDDLDQMITNFSEGDSFKDESLQAQHTNPITLAQSRLILSHLHNLVRNTTGKKISLIVSCDSGTDSTLPAAPTAKVIELPILGKKERCSLLCNMLHSINAVGVRREELDLRLEPQTDGFRPRDVERVATRLSRSLGSKNVSHIAMRRKLDDVLKEFVPLCRLSSETLGPIKEGYVWEDVAGLFRAKEELVSTVVRPSIYTLIYQRAKVQLPRGLLLFGPPGCGKSLIVPALAKRCRFSLVLCRGPELLDKYIGASEAKVRDLFDRAATAAPSILFLDELDSLAPPRGSDHTGVTDRVVNQLLTFLDGVEENSSKGPLYVIAATSRPDKIDPALLRPGRLEKHVYVGLAEDDAEWADVFEKCSRLYKFHKAFEVDLASGKLPRDLLRRYGHLRQLSPADVSAAFGTAQLNAIHEAITCGKSDEPILLSLNHVQEAFRTTRASLADSERKMLDVIYRKYRKDSSKAVDLNDSTSLEVPSQRTALR
jgi:SpoVK/Ycf46/Vps4 family AAA+-type ATPase